MRHYLGFFHPLAIRTKEIKRNSERIACTGRRPDGKAKGIEIIYQKGSLLSNIWTYSGEDITVQAVMNGRNPGADLIVIL